MQQKQKIIFFDLDGPILDVSERYYRVYCKILSDFAQPVLDKSAYWDLKRDKSSFEIIIEASGASVTKEDFFSNWHNLIESDEFIKYDNLNGEVENILSTLSSQYKLVLATLRTHRQVLLDELTSLNIIKHFTDILSNNGQTEPRWQIKYQLMSEYLLSRDWHVGSYMIGDTETDIEAGRHCGAKTIAVSNGIRNKKILEASRPDFIIDDITQLKEIIV